MKQTITIEVPEGKTFNQTTDKDGNIIITYINKKPVRSKTWEEFCKNNPNPTGDNVEYFIDNSSKIVEYKSHGEYDKERKAILDKNSLATKEDAEGILALIQLTRLYDEWISDWKPDYKNDKQVKWEIEYVRDEPHIVLSAHNSCMLSFPTKQIAEEFLVCFKDLIETAKRFI